MEYALSLSISISHDRKPLGQWSATHTWNDTTMTRKGHPCFPAGIEPKTLATDYKLILHLQFYLGYSGEYGKRAIFSTPLTQAKKHICDIFPNNIAQVDFTRPDHFTHYPTFVRWWKLILIGGLPLSFDQHHYSRRSSKNILSNMWRPDFLCRNI